MAKKQVVMYSYTCDVCGTEIPDSAADGASRKFSWEGSDYVIDVCDAHGSELGEVLGHLKGFVDAGHRGGAGRGRKAVGAASASSTRAPKGRRASSASAAGTAPKRGDLPAIRSWAQANGHAVGDRGRIPATVMAAYDEAQSAPAPTPPEPEPPKRRPRKAAAAR